MASAIPFFVVQFTNSEPLEAIRLESVDQQTELLQTIQKRLQQIPIGIFDS